MNRTQRGKSSSRRSRPFSTIRAVDGYYLGDEVGRAEEQVGKAETTVDRLFNGLSRNAPPGCPLWVESGRSAEPGSGVRCVKPRGYST